MSLRGVTHRIWSLKYSCVRFRRAAAVWGRGQVCPFHGRRRGVANWLFGFSQNNATKGGSFAIIRIRQFKTLRSTHRFGYRWNVGSSNGKSHDGAGNAPLGRIFFPWFLPGILQPHRTAAGDSALFLCRERNWGQRKERSNEYTESWGGSLWVDCRWLRVEDDGTKLG